MREKGCKFTGKILFSGVKCNFRQSKGKNMVTLNSRRFGVLLKKPSARLLAYCFYFAGVLMAAAATVVLIASESVR
jgi:hypothetical protein